jgi:hypothetical protein
MKRSWPWTIGWLITAAVSFGLAALAVQSALAPDGGWLGWVGAVVVGGFGLVAGYLAIFSAGSVPCTNCEKAITGFEPGRKELQIGLCPDCNVYVEFREGVMRVMTDDDISERHVFRVSVDGNNTWPATCLVCNAAADRQTESTWDLSKTGRNVAASAAGLALFAVAGAGFVQYGGGSKITLRTPACALHEGGARVFGASGGRAIIGFRSRRAHRAFLEANRHATIEPSIRGMVEPDGE